MLSMHSFSSFLFPAYFSDPLLNHLPLSVMFKERKFQGTKVPGNESSTLWNFRSRERKFFGTKVPATLDGHTHTDGRRATQYLLRSLSDSKSERPTAFLSLSKDARNRSDFSEILRFTLHARRLILTFWKAATGFAAARRQTHLFPTLCAGCEVHCSVH